MQGLLRRARLWNRQRLRARHLHRRGPDYLDWCRRYDTPDAAQRMRFEARAEALAAALPADGPRVDLLLPGPVSSAQRGAIVAALRAQCVRDWRLLVAVCDADGAAERAAWLAQVADEPRIVAVPCPAGARVAALLEAARAPVVGFLDPDEVWRAHTMLLLLEALAARPAAQAVYGDEDALMPDGTRAHPWCKSDFDPDALLAMDTVGAPSLWRREPLLAQLKAAGVTVDDGPAWRHALVLAATAGLDAETVLHVPHLLAHRSDPLPVHVGAAVAAVQRHLDRRDVPARAEPAPQGRTVRVRFALQQPAPRVLIVIPTRNGLGVLRQAVDSILVRTRYPDYRIVIVDNGSDDVQCLAWMRETAAREPRVTICRDDRPFNFAALNNAAIEAPEAADCECVALVNNDIEVVDGGWLEEMVSLACRPGVGAVGARLWYPDGTLQHGGVLVGLGGAAGHALKRLRRDEPGPAERAWRLQGYLAVTAACLVVRRDAYLAVGGMDAQGFPVAFNDVDFCLQLASVGLRNLWTPHAELIHHESVSRGDDHRPERRARYEVEYGKLRERWPLWIARDPFYSPLLGIRTEDFALADPPRALLDEPWLGEASAMIDPLPYDAPFDRGNRNESHTLTFEQVIAAAAPGARVLEAGCATGTMGEALRAEGYRVTGIEPLAAAAERARARLDRVFTGTLDEWFDAHPDERFDVVTFGDVIEHLADPLAALRRTVAHLAPGGAIVASVPNVAHAAVRAMLLEGRWEMGPLGILDRTHLRFFSRESLVGLFSEAGLAIEAMSATVQPADAVGRAFGMKLRTRTLAWIDWACDDDALDIFQYVLTARPAPDLATAAAANAGWADGTRPVVRALPAQPRSRRKLQAIRTLLRG
jgi:GT2 family glycosyltransferase/2-polyprenyl-3-methyl-5-hydroxy-6-metoxy-1,4-benzoquinol methylase